MLRAIFSANPGRSGSHYLSELLAEAVNCEAHHELEPSGFGKPLAEMNRGRPDLMNAVAHEKLAQIEEANDRGKIFCDTSHCFIKGFGWPLMDLMDPADVGIVVLTRDRDAMVESTLRAQSLPLNARGKRYILTPDRTNPIVSPPRFLGLGGQAAYAAAKTAEFLTWKHRGLRGRLGLHREDTIPVIGYQRAALGWYWNETYALARRFRDRFPASTYAEMKIADLNDPEKVADLFERFGLEPEESLAQKIGRPTNVEMPMGKQT